MRHLLSALAGGAIVVCAFLLMQGQPVAAQQPPNYNDIAQSDFEKIDNMVGMLAEPLKKGDTEEFRKVFRRHCSPALQEIDAFVGAMAINQQNLGKTKEVKYVRHEAIKNITDYYVFYYADLREKTISPWELTFYRTGDEWKIVGYRTDSDSPVEFFKFSELQYESFSR